MLEAPLWSFVFCWQIVIKQINATFFVGQCDQLLGMLMNDVHRQERFRNHSTKHLAD